MLYQLDEDIWITNKPVLPHVDSTAEGMLTYGFVLVNEGYLLIHGGNEIRIPAGTLYQLDGRIEHETRGEGLLALLIWDMPDWSLDIFRKELEKDKRCKIFPNFL